MTEIAVFGGGCFWCTEAVFQMLKGVASVAPGYAGGAVPNPTYQQVSDGTTGHAEVIKIEYDPAQVKYEDLLTVFFASHDPTTVNRQGNDVGEQYRSVVFYTTPAQKEAAENYIKELNESTPEGRPAVTDVKPLKPDEFYEAEDYHKNYYQQNQNQPYCQAIIAPKLAKAKQKFAKLLKEQGQ